ncbi:Ig-like domain-containing protein [Aliivibrio fischeri]|uniref:Ig-like domain-containing protein n=1 Tax=Aliivibrio fischeri TaxID=668 RepID=UPI0018C549C8|nr:Ig-like domain-containing protein [Aliivibrio fischeri]
MIKRTSKVKMILVVLTSLLLISCKNDDDAHEHSNISTITITPKEVPTRGVSGYVLRPAQQLELIAIAENRDNTTQDITKHVTWHSTVPEVAKINGSSVVGVNIGETDISARYNGIESSDSIHIKVAYGKIKNLRITPAITSTSKTLPVQLNLTGVFRDRTTANISTRRWSSSNEDVASVSMTGLVTPKKVGEATITARKGGKKATAKIIVTDAKLEKITVVPLNASKVTKDGVIIAPIGIKTRLTAIGMFSDHTTINFDPSKVTWKSEDEQIATVSNQGEITPKKRGKVNITVTKDGISETSKLEVTYAKIEKIIIEDGGGIETPAGREVQIPVSAIYTDGRKIKNFPLAQITLSPQYMGRIRYGEKEPNTPIIPVFIPAPMLTGKVTATATIPTMDDSLSATSTITITPKALERIVITPKKASVPLNGTIQLTAKGVFSELPDVQRHITNVAWDTTRYDIIALDNKGKVTPLKEGSADVIATKDSIQATVTITVEDKLVSISFKEKEFYITNGGPSKTVEVIGTTQSGRKIVLKNSSLKFHSNDPDVASVINNRIKNKKQGSATITAISEVWSDKGRKLLSAQMRITCIKFAGPKITCRAINI